MKMKNGKNYFEIDAKHDWDLSCNNHDVNVRKWQINDFEIHANPMIRDMLVCATMIITVQEKWQMNSPPFAHHLSQPLFISRHPIVFFFHKYFLRSFRCLGWFIVSGYGLFNLFKIHLILLNLFKIWLIYFSVFIWQA